MEKNIKDHAPKSSVGNGPKFQMYDYRLWCATIIEPIISVIT